MELNLNRQQARERLEREVAMFFDLAESAEEWGRHDLAHEIRAMAFDFHRGGECATSSKRRRPGQPSPFVANRRRARVDKLEQQPKRGPVR